MGARTLGIERHPGLQKGAELCEKTVKTPFSLQKATRQTAEVVGAQGVAVSRTPNYAKICPPALQKESGAESGAVFPHPPPQILNPKSQIPNPKSYRARVRPACAGQNTIRPERSYITMMHARAVAARAQRRHRRRLTCRVLGLTHQAEPVRLTIPKATEPHG